MSEDRIAYGSHGRRLAIVVLGIVMALALGMAVVLNGCGPRDGASTPRETTSTETSVSPDPLNPPPQPPPISLKSPENAVRSYVEWITLAYYILDSDVATPTLTPEEEVRVNSYVQYNKEKGRAIDQKIVGFEVTDVRTEDDTATVKVKESWEYRYIDFVQRAYSSPVYKVQYDSTYTVLRQPDGRWLVARVRAQAIGEAPK